MSRVVGLSSLPLLTLACALLVGCGPESNSRYGDSYWDPWDTKDTFDPVEAPSYKVEFVDTDGTDGQEIFEARITLDATETYERVDYGFSWGFIRGTKERETLQPLGATDDFSLVYEQNPDDPADDDRLVATTPGHYSIVFEGESEGPLGKVTFRFDDLSFTLPGCPTTFDYYADYIDDTLEICASCHDAGDASTALDLPDNNFNNRRTNFLNFVRNDAENVLPEWVNDTNHLGAGTLPAGSEDYASFAEFVSILEQVMADNGGNLTTGGNGDTVPATYCIGKPSGFEFTQE